MSDTATTHGFALFDTAIGSCGIAWGERGIVGAQLPDVTPGRTRAAMRQRFPRVTETTPPSSVNATIGDIVALLKGGRPDLTTAPLDMTGVPTFNRRVYEITRGIAPGSTLTYGEIAHRLRIPGSAQAVGQAMGRNPFAPIVPCHRVLAAGDHGGFSANGGVATKRRMLVIEGALVDEPTLF